MSGIAIEVEWTEVEPTGAKCCGCEDACYLQQFAMHIGGKLVDDGDLCQACYDALKDQTN